MTLAQTDVKRLIAYSSISHMGFVTLGIFTLNRNGIEGAILQMINHGIITGALFLCVGMIYERTHTQTVARGRRSSWRRCSRRFCGVLPGCDWISRLERLRGEFPRQWRFSVWPGLGFMAIWGVALGTTYISGSTPAWFLVTPGPACGAYARRQCPEVATLLPLVIWQWSYRPLS